jgi:hypothetical protein
MFLQIEKNYLNLKILTHFFEQKALQINSIFEVRLWHNCFSYESDAPDSSMAPAPIPLLSELQGDTISKSWSV